MLGGVLRGAGRQTLGAIIAGLVAYCLGLPLQIALGFKLGLGVAGMWWGAAFSSTVQAVVEVRRTSLKYTWKACKVPIQRDPPSPACHGKGNPKCGHPCTCILCAWRIFKIYDLMLLQHMINLCSTLTLYGLWKDEDSHSWLRLTMQTMNSYCYKCIKDRLLKRCIHRGSDVMLGSGR